MSHHAFNIKALGEPVVSMEISEEKTLPEMIEAFEKFLYAVGYRLPDGATLGYEWDESGTDPVY
jgi:hypothetical protein